MSAWQIVASALGALWLIGSPAGVWLWLRHEVKAEEAADRAAEDAFVAAVMADFDAEILELP